MLEFAVVDVHGRELAVRLSIRGSLFVFLLSATVAAQGSSTYEDLLPELVAKVASILPSGTQVRLTAFVVDAAEDAAVLQSRLGVQLSARGIRINDATATGTDVAISCGGNVRERVCIAEIRGDGRDQIATVTRPLRAAGSPVPGTALALELRPLISQQTTILDAAVVDERLVVLDTAALTVFEQKEGAWRLLQSRPIPASRPWPRDARGRLRTAQGRLEVYLPGMTCAGRLNPLEFECSERQQSWPIGVGNRGLEPGRNFFTTPEGLAFYNAAPLDADGPGRWLVAGRDGTLQGLSDEGRPVAIAGMADDVVALRAACAPGTLIVLASGGAGTDGGDLLRLSRVTPGGLRPVASPVVLPGVLTALWPQADPAFALVVTHDIGAGHYDAFRTSVSCSR